MSFRSHPHMSFRPKGGIHPTCHSDPTRKVKNAPSDRLSTPTSQPDKDAPHLYGFHPIPAGGNPVTNEMVDDLRRELGI